MPLKLDSTFLSANPETAPIYFINKLIIIACDSGSGPNLKLKLSRLLCIAVLSRFSQCDNIVCRD